MAIWVPPASFSWSIARASRDRPYPIARSMLDKLGNRQILEALGAPVSTGFEIVGSMTMLTRALLATPTALKPVRGSNNRGFLALVPAGHGTWRELTSDRRLGLEEIREELAHALLRDGLSDSWLREDLLRDADGRLVDDIKLLMFRGRLGAAFVRRNYHRAFRWFDADWRPLDPGLSRHPIDPSIAAPDHREAITALASRISAALPLPFVRVDVYPAASGPVVGEITPFPGWAHDLAPALDRDLGRLYEEAESEMLAEGMDWASIASPQLRDFMPAHARGIG